MLYYVGLAFCCYMFYHLGAGHFDNQINKVLQRIGLKKEFDESFLKKDKKHGK
jgi:hypothetical protein